MNYIFYGLIVLSIVIGAINGKLPDVVNSILTGAEKSVQIAFSLIGIMAFWLGIMRIAEKSGVVEFIAKIIKPITKRLFDEIPPEDPAIGNIAMNFSANALGLTNAATPIGLKAMQDLQIHNINKKTASNAMCMFLAMNTASFQLVPAAVIAILVGVGYKNATEIIAPTLIVTSFTFMTAIILAKIFQKFSAPQEVEEQPLSPCPSPPRGEGSKTADCPTPITKFSNPAPDPSPLGGEGDFQHEERVVENRMRGNETPQNKQGGEE